MIILRKATFYVFRKMAAMFPILKIALKAVINFKKFSLIL